MNNQPVAVIRKALIGWYVHVECGWKRRGLKADGVVSPWWRPTLRSAQAKGARVAQGMI